MSNSSAKTLRLTQLSLLVALLAVLAFTPLGFIMIPPVAITIMHIPVIIGAVLLGPWYGGMLGLAFGVMSMLKATFSAASPVDLLFSPFVSGAPFQSLIMCIVPRVLLGLLAGVLFQFLGGKMKNQSGAIGISAGVAAVSHSLLVLGCLWLFFRAMPLREVFVTIISLNGILEMLAAIVVSTAVCRPLLAFMKARK